MVGYLLGVVVVVVYLGGRIVVLMFLDSFVWVFDIDLNVIVMILEVFLLEVWLM